MDGRVHTASNALVIKNNSQVVEAMALQKTVEASIVMAMLNITDTIVKNGDIICQQFGITTQQWLILLHLAADPNIAFVEESKMNRPIFASDLAEALNVSRPNITSLVTTLMDKKLVQQIMDKTDRRKKFLTLTTEGRRILEAIEPFRHRANERFLIQLSSAQRAQFLSFLRSSAETLEADFGK
jgi:MarR family transcriptional regulator, temperature-dependent positive regulator of motility